MKSLVLKDLYNIGHNGKSVLVTLVFVGVFLSFTTDGNTGFFCIFCAVMCSTMVISSFSYDTVSNWEPYAMILPVTRREVVRGKFVILLIFSLLGCLLGLLLGLIVGTVVSGTAPDLREQLFYILPGFTVSIFMSSTSVPLIFKYGAEKARLLLLGIFFFPAAAIVLILKLLERAGVHLPDQAVVQFFTFAPLLILVWAYLMYRISCNVFAHKEI